MEELDKLQLERERLAALELEVVTKRIKKSTIQFFHIKESIAGQDIPEGNGSGVLIKYKDQYLIFTAAHVIADGRANEIFIYLNDGVTMFLSSAMVHTSMPNSGKRTDDEVDVAIVMLQQFQVDEIEKMDYLFMDYDEILIDFKPENQELVLCLGYPANIFFDPVDNGLYPNYMSFSNIATISTRVGVNKRTSDLHVIVEYPITKLENPLSENRKQRHTGPNPHGMSGGGMWALTLPKDELIFHPRLIAIMTEYDSIRHRIIGTKIEALSIVLERHFDALKKLNEENKD